MDDPSAERGHAAGRVLHAAVRPGGGTDAEVLRDGRAGVRQSRQLPRGDRHGKDRGPPSPDRGSGLGIPGQREAHGDARQADGGGEGGSADARAEAAGGAVRDWAPGTT